MNVKVIPTADGAIISVENIEITITVKAKPPVPAGPPGVAPTPVGEAVSITVEAVRARLAPYLSDVTVAEETEGVVVRPTGYLGRDKFNAIAAVVRGLGGRYVSAGRESHFIIPSE